MPAGTTYQQVLDAVGSYYGTGSDQWVSIAKYGVAAQDVETIIEQVPGASIVKNKAGQITAMTYENPFSYSNGGIAGEINSNVQLPTQGNGNTFTSQIPSSGGIESLSGNIQPTSGAKSTATNATVPTTFARVGTAVAGLAFGMRLGTKVLNSLYQGNPEYWDETLPTINPQTWDSIAGDNQVGKSVINALFGINKDTGTTTMYLPEDALDYYAYAMAQQGFFNTGGMTFPEYKNTDPYTITTARTASQMFDFAKTAIIHGVDTITETAQNKINTFMSQYGHLPAICNVYVGTGDYSGFSPLKVWALTSTNVGDTVTLGRSVNAMLLQMYGGTFSGNPFNFTDARIDPQSVTLFTGDYVSGTTHWYSGLGAQETSGKEGTEKVDGATYPDTTGWTDPQSAGQSLRNQRPDLYQNSVYTDVPQPDGTVKRIVYVPVSTTPTTSATDTQPVTGDTPSTDNTTVTDQSPIDIVNTIIRYITQTRTETPTDTPTPPNTPNPTDTGDGDTPPVVVPTGNASALWSVYNPTQAQLNSFGAWLWSSNFIDQILKLFNNPMQSIIGVHKIFATPPVSGSGNIVVGYLDSGVGSNLVSAQYTTVNCGTVNVREQFGNVFDYTDTQIRLYLPFIGIVDLDVSDVMRGAVSVVYHVDVITGACLAEVKIIRDGAGGTLYQYAGDAAVRYPISSGSYMGVVAGIASAVGGVASAIASGGATLPLAAGAVAGGIGGAHTTVQHSGNFSGNAGAMGAKKPYIIIERPQTLIANGFENYQGSGNNTIRSVSQMSGYFKMSDVKTDSISGASESEIEAIKSALETGVYT